MCSKQLLAVDTLGSYSLRHMPDWGNANSEQPPLTAWTLYKDGRTLRLDVRPHPSAVSSACGGRRFRRSQVVPDQEQMLEWITTYVSSRRRQAGLRW